MVVYMCDFWLQGSVPVLDEDMNGGGKRAGRAARAPSVPAPTTNLADIKLADGPVPPKHIPFPYIPQDGTLLFEAMTFVFSLVATGLQFLNLYRTAWWLPHSYTNQAMVSKSVLKLQSIREKWIVYVSFPYVQVALHQLHRENYCCVIK